MELENIMDKDEILAAYMNDVYLGASNYGFRDRRQRTISARR